MTSLRQRGARSSELADPDIVERSADHTLGTAAAKVRCKSTDRRTVVCALTSTSGITPPSHFTVTVTMPRVGLDHFQDMIRLAVEDLLLVVVSEGEAELGCDHHSIADRLKRFADQLVVGEGTVDLGVVEEGDAQIEVGIGVVPSLSAVNSSAPIIVR
ncbi:hypothetical protein VY88_24835 [Azospirillum thiophilum]|uniref:Uncharacterized protein n=1 Tax=Azospirillum thiophilum TaxID=528244 RepID=A0AAC8ZWM4_9PROT|nr:hypothetical protein AL072_30845 [Azospirillum thiophilum]KJR62223.1 hypothetical protein VY88_24835 [Azospirillum thiophilum]